MANRGIIQLIQGWVGFTPRNYRHPMNNEVSGGYYVTTVERVPAEYWAQHGSAYQIGRADGLGYEHSRSISNLLEPPASGDAHQASTGWVVIPLYYKKFDCAQNVDPTWGEEGL